MPDPVLEEGRDLLREMRDLLVPVAGANEEAHEARQAVLLQRKREAVRAELSTDRRRKAWALADGSRTQRQIAREAGMDEGGASRFFKGLRDIQAIVDNPNPTRTLELE